MKDNYIEFINVESQRLINQAKDLSYYDAGVWFGCPEYFPLSHEFFLEDLSRMTDTYFAKGGMISHWEGYSSSAQEGNKILAELDTYLPDSWYTTWTGLPLTAEEPGLLPGKNMSYGKMRGVRMFPKSHRYRFLPWAVASICRWCGETRIPIFLWHVEVDWDDLYETAVKYNHCSFVIETQWQKILYHIRNLFGLMEICPNIYVEISNFAGQDYLRDAVDKFGSHRFLYSSFFPVNDPFVPMGILQLSDLSEEHKKKIAGENLQEMIKGVAF
jgi:hypothetical protein